MSDTRPTKKLRYARALAIIINAAERWAGDTVDPREADDIHSALQVLRESHA